MSVPELRPGSALAVGRGCLCPVIDNARGRGYMGGVRDEAGRTVYVIRADCPVHGYERGRMVELDYDDPDSPVYGDTGTLDLEG